MRRLVEGVGAGEAGCGHERFPFLAELAGDVEEVGEPVDACLEATLVLAEAAPPVGGIVRTEDIANVLDRDLEVAQPADRPGDLELVRAIAAVAGEPIDIGGPQQAELVVVPEGADREPGQPGESPDRDQIAVARDVVPAAWWLHARHREPSGWSRVKHPLAETPAGLVRAAALMPEMGLRRSSPSAMRVSGIRAWRVIFPRRTSRRPGKPDRGNGHTNDARGTPGARRGSDPTKASRENPPPVGPLRRCRARARWREG
jgi:hypothetical protein